MNKLRNIYTLLIGVMVVLMMVTVVTQRETTMKGSDQSTAIVVIVKDSSKDVDYKIAFSSVKCYAEVQNYRLIYVNYEKNRTLQRICPQRDFFFTRHCIMAQLLDDNPPEEFYLFLDADIGVINPNKRIEEFLPKNPRTHILFYQRFYNSEIMAGSYIVRKSQVGKDFLRLWAFKYFEISEKMSMSGTDNGAIHSAVVEFFLPEMAKEREICELTWRAGKNFEDLFTYESCIQFIISNSKMADRGIEIYEKGKGWARDGWLTETRWCQSDFFFHGWKKQKIGGEWNLPFTSEDLFVESCRGDGAERWKYSEFPFEQNCTTIEKELEILYEVKNGEHLGRLGKLLAANRLPMSLTANGRGN